MVTYQIIAEDDGEARTIGEKIAADPEVGWEYDADDVDLPLAEADFSWPAEYVVVDVEEETP